VAYTLRGDELHVDPVPVCGGCPACRASGRSEFSFTLPEPDAIGCVHNTMDAALQRILGTTNSLVLVACPRSEKGRRFRKKLVQFVLPKLVRLGIREVAMPPDLQKEKNCRDLYRHSTDRFLIHRDFRDTDHLRTDIAVPRVTLFLTDSTEPIPETVINVERPLHVIFAWDDVPDRNRPGSRFFDRAVHSNFNDLLGRLNQ